MATASRRVPAVSNPRTRRTGLRGLLFMGLILAALLAVADLLRPDSLLLNLFDVSEDTPVERAIDDVRSGLGDPLR